MGVIPVSYRNWGRFAPLREQARSHRVVQVRGSELAREGLQRSPNSYRATNRQTLPVGAASAAMRRGAALTAELPLPGQNRLGRLPHQFRIHPRRRRAFGADQQHPRPFIQPHRRSIDR